jgi:hypothetical protein
MSAKQKLNYVRGLILTIINFNCGEDYFTLSSFFPLLAHPSFATPFLSYGSISKNKRLFYFLSIRCITKQKDNTISAYCSLNNPTWNFWVSTHKRSWHVFYLNNWPEVTSKQTCTASNAVSQKSSDKLWMSPQAHV